MSDVRHIWNRIFETDWEVKEGPGGIMQELLDNIGGEKVENDLQETRQRVDKVMESPQNSSKVKLFCPRGPGKCVPLSGAPESLAFAVGAYTGPDIYKHINRALRDSQFDKFPLFLKHLVRALRYLPYDETKYLYRGIAMRKTPDGKRCWTMEDFNQGSLMVWYGFTSMTQSKRIAQHFAGRKGLILKLKAQTGCDISPLSPLTKKSFATTINSDSNNVSWNGKREYFCGGARVRIWKETLCPVD
eukprot:TRINITY_DN2869_c0_g1_i1.p1 TRINITY_DN2869_c0_g1~~TRINITY_DN2869_c0_g1_i1.p1  ORF type:complete len:245 (+),score=28.52 TRINITY_DN2869_c0_g1_i1:297-1031(+)